MGAIPWSGLLILGLVLAVYAPALRNGFVWDDINNLLASSRLRSWASIPEVFRQPAMWSAALPIGPIGTYRPLSLASFVLDYKLYGLRPWGFHLTSVVLHGVAQVLVFRLYRGWLRDPRAAMVLCLLCALHPASVEAVAWINGRSEIFALLFGVAALRLAATYGDRPGPGRALWCGLCLLLSLLGKETGAIFLPLSILASARPAVEGRPPAPATRWAIGAAAAGALLTYLALRLQALGGGAVPRGGAWQEVLRAVPALWVRALQAVLVPVERAPITVQLWLRQLSPVESAAHLLAAAAILGVGVILLRRRPLSALGLFWWLAALLPASLVAISSWPGLHRWLYVGLPGLFLCCGAGLPDLLVRRPRAKLVLGLVVVGLGLLTARAVPVWRSDATLFSQMIEESPEDPYGYQGLGVVLIQTERYEAAAQVFSRAIELGATHDGAYTYLALALTHLGRCDEALALYGRHPDPLVAPERFQLDAGTCLHKAGRGEEATRLLGLCAPRLRACEEALRALR